MSEELKPCPFCGGKCDPQGWMNIDGEWGPECENCGATGPSAEGWNTRVELAALKAEQGEAVAHVSEESFSSDGTSDIITRNLPIGTALYTAPPASADAVSVPRELLEFPAADDHEKAIGWEYSYEFISQVERLVASRTEFTTSMEAVQETLKAACELRALLAQSQEVKS